MSFDDAPQLAGFTAAERNRLRYGRHLWLTGHVGETNCVYRGDPMRLPQSAPAPGPAFPILTRPVNEETGE